MWSRAFRRRMGLFDAICCNDLGFLEGRVYDGERRVAWGY
jgi:hypothetical protein